MYVKTYAYIYIRMFVQVSIYIYIHVYTYVHIHVYIHIYEIKATCIGPTLALHTRIFVCNSVCTWFVAHMLVDQRGREARK